MHFLQDPSTQYISCMILSGNTFLARYSRESCKISSVCKNFARNLMFARITQEHGIIMLSLARSGKNLARFRENLGQKVFFSTRALTDIFSHTDCFQEGGSNAERILENLRFCP